MNSDSDFNRQPTLQGPNLQLRPLTPDDFENLYAVAADPLIWEQHPHPDRYKREIFKEFFDGAIKSKGAFVVVHCGTRDLIGSSRYYDFDPGSRTVKIGYTFLGRQYWGGKFNHEMKGLMLGHAFKAVKSVYFEIGEANQRSRQAIENIGARLVESKLLNGTPYVVYGITYPSPSP